MILWEGKKEWLYDKEKRMISWEGKKEWFH